MQTTIRANLEDVSRRMRQAARAAGRAEDAARLVVVTKAQPVEAIRAAIEAGAEILGENYPEETLPKMQALQTGKEVAWHMIGHLQSRKADLVAAHFDMLQSLDSLRLVEKLERQLAQKNRVLPVLLEINVSGEESKNGWPGWEEARWEQLLPEVEQVMAAWHLDLRGLMTMPPYEVNAEINRPYFARLRRLAEFLGKRFGAERFSQLSMGTSADYEVAVQEGATLVRIGTAIMGPRPSRT